MRPHSLFSIDVMTFCASYDRFFVWVTMEYVDMTIPVLPRNMDLESAVKVAMSSGLTLDHLMNSAFHWTTDMALVQSTIIPFLMVQAAVMPTRVFPAPQGNTMIPLLARPFPNI